MPYNTPHANPANLGHVQHTNGGVAHVRQKGITYFDHGGRYLENGPPPRSHLKSQCGRMRQSRRSVPILRRPNHGHGHFSPPLEHMYNHNMASQSQAKRRSLPVRTNHMPLPVQTNRMPLPIRASHIPLPAQPNRMPLPVQPNRMPLSVQPNRMPLPVQPNRKPLLVQARRMSLPPVHHNRALPVYHPIQDSTRRVSLPIGHQPHIHENNALPICNSTQQSRHVPIPRRESKALPIYKSIEESRLMSSKALVISKPATVDLSISSRSAKPQLSVIIPDDSPTNEIAVSEVGLDSPPDPQVEHDSVFESFRESVHHLLKLKSHALHEALKQFFEGCSNKQISALLRDLSPKVPNLACDRQGSLGLISLMGMVRTDEHIELMAESFSQDAARIMVDEFGHKVIVRFVTEFMLPATEFAFEAARKDVGRMASSCFGQRSVRALLEQGEVSEKLNLHEAILPSVYRLASSQHGHLLIKYLVENASPELLKKIHVQLSGKYAVLARLKYGVVVVKSALRQWTGASRKAIFEELMGCAGVLINDLFGSFCLRETLAVISDSLIPTFILTIHPHLASLKSAQRSQWEEKLIAAECGRRGLKKFDLSLPEIVQDLECTSTGVCIPQQGVPRPSRAKKSPSGKKTPTGSKPVWKVKRPSKGSKKSPHKRNWSAGRFPPPGLKKKPGNLTPQSTPTQSGVTVLHLSVATLPPSDMQQSSVATLSDAAVVSEAAKTPVASAKTPVASKRTPKGAKRGKFCSRGSSVPKRTENVHSVADSSPKIYRNKPVRASNRTKSIPGKSSPSSSSPHSSVSTPRAPTTLKCGADCPRPVLIWKPVDRISSPRKDAVKVTAV
eukprot:294274_1